MQIHNVNGSTDKGKFVLFSPVSVDSESPTVTESSAGFLYLYMFTYIFFIGHT